MLVNAIEVKDLWAEKVRPFFTVVTSRENLVARQLLRSRPRRSEGQHLAALVPISALTSL